MVIIGFGCGLGNQMFQYAFYLSMKRKHPELEVKADIKYAFNEEHNGFELNKVFGLCLPECMLKERKKYSDIPFKKTWLTRNISNIKHSLGLYKKSFYHQPDYTEFLPEVYQISPNQNKYLLGIWANEKYFADLKEELQMQVFTFKQSLNTQGKLYQKKILNTLSVSIHVRKGDYVQYGNHVMGKPYYRKAMSYIEERIKCSIQYFVFSDDIDYARELLGGPTNVTYVVGNYGKDSWMDMYLMSLCKHNIIANSSFSFWGAYLNRNENKIVIASSIPFVRCKYPFSCKDWVTFDAD